MTDAVNPRVVGLDLSLTSTGVAGDDYLTAVGPGARRGVDRLTHLRDQVVGFVAEQRAQLVVIEGPSYGNQGTARQAGHHERAGLWWLVRVALAERGTPVAVVPPATLKKYATGKGNADKTAMALAAFKRFGFEGYGDDAVDAAWLRAMGLDHLGAPCVAMPEGHRAALAAVDWPEMVERPWPSVHNPITKSYAIDQIRDVEHLRRIAHRMWEAFQAAHEQAAHACGVLMRNDCPECTAALHGDRETGCARWQQLQAKVSDGFGSV